MNYSSIDLSKFELHNSDPELVIQALVNENGKNRSERRKIAKAFSKVQNRDKYYVQQRARENMALRDQYQKELEEKLDHATEAVHNGLIDNWKKSMALAALVLKRKYNWSDGRIGMLIDKANQLHIEMVKSGEWEHIDQILEDECGIELEVSDD